jgi:hypothetical protein
LPNAFALRDPVAGSDMTSTLTVPARGRASYRSLVNPCARLAEAGTFEVTIARPERWGDVEVVPATLVLRPMEPERRAAEIARLRRAADAAPRDPAPLRSLAFFHDAALAPFFLDRLRGWGDGASHALAAVADRPAVLRAMEGRLYGGDVPAAGLLATYVRLAAPGDPNAQRTLRTRVLRRLLPTGD